jgi:hypothetical protein
MSDPLENKETDAPQWSRREVLGLGVASVLTWMTACNTSPSIGGNPPPVFVTNAPYRYQEKQLFQPIPAAFSPSRLAGGEPYDWRSVGATAGYVDARAGWNWRNVGGDWLDANRVLQGSSPWFSFKSNAVTGNVAKALYTVDVTSALQFIQQEKRWNTLLLLAKAPRVVAGSAHPTDPAPSLEVRYADGTIATLKTLYVNALDPSSQLSLSGNPEVGFPLALEFERPTKVIQTATLRLMVLQHWSGDSTIDGFVIDPPVNVDPVTVGVAATRGSLDADLNTHPSVFGVHRYVDGTQLVDFADPQGINTSAEREFDPAIYGNGATDTTKLPHRSLGKWINASSENFSVVPSSYTDEGFSALSPGLGALRVIMPATPNLSDGFLQGDSQGTLASNAKIFLPEPEFGRLKRLFIRYYLRLGTPYETPFSKRYQVYQYANTAPIWLNMTGKGGITPAHDTSYGGTTGSSGGGYGWQMRLSWSDCDAGLGGPSEGGISLGLHTYDFLSNNAPFPYGQTDTPKDAGFGQRGGLGGYIYAGHWYCLELEVDLNTVMPEAPGYKEDGAIRMWVDGRLAFERTKMVVRRLPLAFPAIPESTIRPVRELGHRDLWFNWFHGGKTRNSIDRVMFVSQLVWSREYIGPMKV